MDPVNLFLQPALQPVNAASVYRQRSVHELRSNTGFVQHHTAASEPDYSASACKRHTDNVSVNPNVISSAQNPQTRFFTEQKTRLVDTLLTQKLRKEELGCRSPAPALACFSCGLEATRSWFWDKSVKWNEKRKKDKTGGQVSLGGGPYS